MTHANSPVVQPRVHFHVCAALIDDIEEFAERGIEVPCETVLRLDEPGTRSHVRYRGALSGRAVSLATTLLNGARGVCAVVGLSKARTTSSKPRPVFPSMSADV